MIMKWLYLIFKRFKKMALCEISLFFLIAVLCMSFAYTVCYSFESGAKQRYAKSQFDDDMIILELKPTFYDDYYLEEDITQEMMEENFATGNLYGSEKWSSAYEKIMKITNAQGILRYSELDITIDGWAENERRSLAIGETLAMDYHNDRRLVSYDETTLTKAPFKMSEGRWFTPEEMDGIDLDEGEEIPVILSKDWDMCYDVGDVIEGRVAAFTTKSKKMPPDNIPEGELKFRVIGKMSKDAYLYAMQQYEQLPFDEAFIRAGDSFDRASAYMISPELFVKGKLAPTDLSGIFNRQMLFIYKEGIANEDYSNELAEYGTIHTALEYAKKDGEAFREGSNTFTIHLILSGMMLMVSIVGYNMLLVARMRRTHAIYFAVGMTKKKGIGITLIGNLLVFAISGAIGLAIGLVFAQNSRVMSQDSVVYTVLTVAGSLILLYFAAGGLSSAMLYRENPSDMLTKE